ncbi:hypothetical protein [Ekhidna sp.]|uniref:TolB family protein n=1 Tax=Ekhidna sp. TaxID=2608089 RepID=UPI0032ED80F4
MKFIKYALVFSCLFILFSSHLVVSQEYKIVFQDLEWTPDGETIAFTAIRVKSDWSDYSSDKWGLYMYSLKSKSLIQIDSGTLYFDISPNGDRIVYDKRDGKNSNLYLWDVRSKVSNALVTSEYKDSGPSWSPDGKSIVFYNDKEGKEDLYVLVISSGAIRNITRDIDAKCYNPEWSPGSDFIVYYHERGDNMDQIYLTDREGSFHRNLTNDTNHNIFPTWSADGRIVYVRNEGEVMSIKPDGSEKVQIMNKSGGLVSPSPNGKKLLFVSVDSQGLSLLNMENKHKKRLFESKKIFD